MSKRTFKQRLQRALRCVEIFLENNYFNIFATIFDRYDLYYEHDICPDCYKPLSEHLLLGPCGGMAQNVKCSYCGSYFNDVGFVLDRIKWYNHDADIKKINIKNYKTVRPTFIDNWYPVHIFREIPEYADIYSWCSENCSSWWSIKSGILHSEGDDTSSKDSTFFFKKNSDAVLFSLTFK